MAAPPTARPDPPNATSDSALDVRNSHALLLGKGGEATARFALEHDGTMIHWNASGTAAASPPGEAAAVAGTRVHPPRTAKAAWPALRLAAACPHADLTVIPVNGHAMTEAVRPAVIRAISEMADH